MLPPKHVFVVIVTYKRARILANCLQSLFNQNLAEGDHVHVVVNSRDKETLQLLAVWTASFPLKLTFEILNNEGPAGGFYSGLSRFVAEGRFQYAWLMDDDIVAEPGCLKALLNHAAAHEYLYPSVITSTGKKVVSFGWWGVFLSLDLVRTVGLPLRELFYWAEDSEYLQYRISWKHRVMPFRVDAAVVTHLHNRSSRRPSWYYYYTCRNTIFYRLYRTGITKYGVKVVAGIIPYLVYNIVLRENRKLFKLKLVLLGLWHGLRGKLGKTIDPELYA